MPIEIQEVQTAEEIPNDGDGARKLFEDQEGDPISFWLQVSIHEDIQKSLKKAIEVRRARFQLIVLLFIV